MPRLRAEVLLAIVERLPLDHAAEAETIAKLIEGYRFDVIQELCQ